MNDSDQPDLIRLLTSFLASGKLDAAQVMPALQRHDGVEFARLAEHVHQKRLQETQRFHRLHKQQAASRSDFRLLLGDLPENLPVG